MSNELLAEEGRQAWQRLLEAAHLGNAAQIALSHVLESVVIDIIDNRIAGDDVFARVIGERIKLILPAVEQYLERQGE